jgi:alkylation response protein AidB-like acyl-CoA dehydrogenase
MELRLDEDQAALAATVRRFCADRLPLDRIAERELRPVDRTLWKDLAGLGVFDLLDLGPVEAAVVFEQLGSHLVPGPIAWTVLTAPLLGTDVSTGELMVGGVDASAPPRPATASAGPVEPATDDAGSPPSTSANGVEDATGHGGHGTSGTRDREVVVEHGSEIDRLVVLGPTRVHVIEASELPEAEVLTPFDPLTPVGRFVGLPEGGQVGGAAEAERMRLVGRVMTAALALGVADRAMEVARAYALERHQFGVPIGSFQAVKHMLADMYVRTVLARSSVYAAAATVDEPEVGDPRKASRSAKLLAGEAARENASTAIQILGGMGFTWEMLPNHLLKRAWVLEQSFGTADDHALALGGALGGR